MPDRTLLVPGTQATTLRDQNDVTVYNAVRVSLGLQRESLGGRPPSEWLRLFSIEYEPGELAPTRTSLEDGTDIRPGPVVMTPYDRLPKPLDTWPYDWRLDMRHNAQQLIQHLRDHRPAGGRWNLIGHSQGGIVIVLSSMYTNDPVEFGRLVSRVVLVGTPIAGTQRALEAIAVGRGDFGNEGALWDIARGMAQTWPSLYQMLPSWPSVLKPDGTPFDADRQFTAIGGYPGDWGHGISDDLLLRARQTHQMLEGPLSRFGDRVAVRVIQGEKQDTPVTITRTGNTLPTTGVQHGTRPDLDFEQEPGDTLVPSEETLTWAGPLYGSKAQRFAGKIKEHAFLCDGSFIVSKIRDFLAEPAPPPP